MKKYSIFLAAFLLAASATAGGLKVAPPGTTIATILATSNTFTAAQIMPKLSIGTADGNYKFSAINDSGGVSLIWDSTFLSNTGGLRIGSGGVPNSSLYIEKAYGGNDGVQYRNTAAAGYSHFALIGNNATDSFEMIMGGTGVGDSALVDKALIRSGTSLSGFGLATDGDTATVWLDNAHRVGINTTTPSGMLEIKAESTNSLLRLTSTVGQYRVRVDQNFDLFFSSTDANETTVIYNSGAAIFNNLKSAVDFRVGTDTQDYGLFVDGSADSVGILTDTPGANLDVNGTTRLQGTVTLTLGRAQDSSGFIVGMSTQLIPINISSHPSEGFNGKSEPLFNAPEGYTFTITKTVFTSLPTGATIQYNLSEVTLADLAAAGTDVYSVVDATATAPGATITSFANATVAAGSWVVLQCPASGAGAGTPSRIIGTIYGYLTKD